jgi:hypothetical protein
VLSGEGGDFVFSFGMARPTGEHVVDVGLLRVLVENSPLLFNFDCGVLARSVLDLVQSRLTTVPCHSFYVNYLKLCQESTSRS